MNAMNTHTASDFLPDHRAWNAAAAREGLTQREAFTARMEAIRTLNAHCVELAEVESGADPRRGRAQEEAVAERRARAAAVPALLILSTPIAVSVGPLGAPLHAANLRHSAGSVPTRFVRGADGRVVLSQRGDTLRPSW